MENFYRFLTRFGELDDYSRRIQVERFEICASTHNEKRSGLRYITPRELVAHHILIARFSSVPSLFQNGILKGLRS
jgi:hypothetical protein